MSKVLWITTALLVLQAAHSYILLTANIEDVQNVAKRLVQSPIGTQVGNIVRRAYSVFNNQLRRARAHMRTNDDETVSSGNRIERSQDDDDVVGPKNENAIEEKPAEVTEGLGEQNEVHAESNERRDMNAKGENQEELFSSLGKSASVYLQKIKKIFETA